LLIRSLREIRMIPAPGDADSGKAHTPLDLPGGDPAGSALQP